MVQRGFRSAASAYNEALERSENDLVAFLHQDVFLPEPWIGQLQKAIADLSVSDPDWGVLGCYGTTQDGIYRGYLYSSAQEIHGKPFDRPFEVQTLDEIMLIIRKSSGLRFDQRLPHFHLYGADICLAAAKRGMKSYAICAPCIHNTQQNFVLPREFYRGCAHIRRAWKASLPIQTTCIRITKWNGPLYLRRLQDLYLRHIRRRVLGEPRAPFVDALAEGFERRRRELQQGS
jgi:Glycosyltransferase like family